MGTSRFPSRSKIVTSLIACIATSLLLACTQGEGETCQINRDCEEGLVCRRETSADRGVCIREEDNVTETPDSGDPILPPDMPEDDAGAANAGSSG
jgi:hypothetical protein